MTDLTEVGKAAIASLLFGDAEVDPYDDTNTYLGVGDDDTANGSTNSLEDLVATKTASHYFRQVVSSATRTASTNVISYQTTIGLNDANFEWLENGIFNDGPAAAAGVMLLRTVEDLGTKTSAQSITFTKTLTID